MATWHKRLAGSAVFAAMMLTIYGSAVAQRPPPPTLPEIPATPQMSSEPYPNCRNDFERFSDPYERAEATNRCTVQLDAYHARVLVPYREAMIAHQERITAIYEEQVRVDFDYTQEQADGFFSRITQEHEASNPDGAHMAAYREAAARYAADRELMQDTFCRNAGCPGRPAEVAAPTSRSRERRADRGDRDRGSDECGTERAGGGILGGLLGGVLGSQTGLGAVGGIIAGQFAGVLVAEIACQLTAEEQEKAAEATETVVAEEEVGATASWVSPTRADVSGSSTVTALLSQPNGSTCLDVNDVIIVGGEETTVSKRMCREPGSSRYTLVA